MNIAFIFIGVLLGFSVLLLLPLPIALYKSVDALKPIYWVFLGAVITSGVQTYEGFMHIIKPRQVLAGSVYDFKTDTQYLNALVDVLMGMLVFFSFFLFVVVQKLCLKRANLNEKLQKAELNRMATQKQAEAASKQTLAMLDELESIKSGGSKEVSKVTDIEELRKELSKTRTELEESELKSRIIQENYVKLVEECSKMEKKVSKVENKKDK